MPFITILASPRTKKSRPTTHFDSAKEHEETRPRVALSSHSLSLSLSWFRVYDHINIVIHSKSTPVAST